MEKLKCDECGSDVCLWKIGEEVICSECLNFHEIECPNCKTFVLINLDYVTIEEIDFKCAVCGYSELFD